MKERNCLLHTGDALHDYRRCITKRLFKCRERQRLCNTCAAGLQALPPRPTQAKPALQAEHTAKRTCVCWSFAMYASDCGMWRSASRIMALRAATAAVRQRRSLRSSKDEANLPQMACGQNRRSS